jgi:hypothetical protein
LDMMLPGMGINTSVRSGTTNICGCDSDGCPQEVSGCHVKLKPARALRL